MLSLLLILCIICAVGATTRSAKTHKFWQYKGVLTLCIFIGGILILTESVMFLVIRQNDTGYLQQQINTLTEVNKQIENWIEIVEDELSDNSQLLNHVEQYLNEEMASNNEEINRCVVLQKERVPFYRWLLYFK